MQLRFEFRDGLIHGEGQDQSGPFRLIGRYNLRTGQCQWATRYADGHDAFHRGYSESGSIWGRWQQSLELSGSYHVWSAEQDWLHRERLLKEAQQSIVIELPPDPAGPREQLWVTSEDVNTCHLLTADTPEDDGDRSTGPSR